MSKTVGVLGGMGSYATVDFFKKILDQFKVQKEWEYPKIIINNNPKLPSRTRAILYDEPSPAPGMIEGCKLLEQAGADFIAIPCNSAHAWYEEIVSQVSIPVISIIETTVQYILQNYQNIKRVGVISGEVVIKKKLYEKAFENSKVIVIAADDECEKKVRKIIDDVKHNSINKETKEHVDKVVKYFLQQNVDGLILGCTELPLVMENLPLPTFDSSLILAKKLAEMAK